MTEELEIIKDAWYQFGYYNEEYKKRYHYGLSTLESIYYYLLKKGIINKDGLVIGEEEKEIIEEEKKIEELKEKYEGEILALTIEDGNLRLIAHSLFRNELMDLIGKAYKMKEISENSEIFYR